MALTRSDELDGSQYETLTPAADALSDKDPWLPSYCDVR